MFVNILQKHRNRRHGLVADALLSEQEDCRNCVLLSTGRHLVIEKGYLHTFSLPHLALKEYTRLGSEGSCQSARVMRSICCSSVRSKGTYSYCVRSDKTAYSGELTYSYPRSFGYGWSDDLDSYDENLRCMVDFKSYYDGDGVRLRFKEVDLEPPEHPWDFDTCRDKIVVYDGERTSDPVLTQICGSTTPSVESSGSHLLLVFTTDSQTRGNHKGFSVVYSRIDRNRSTLRTNEPVIGTAACGHINSVSIKLPEFWTTSPEVWFARVEAQFGTKNITQDQTRYDYVVSALDVKTAEEVQDVLVTPPDADKYATLKKALIKAFGESQAQRDSELLNLNGLGDRKPTALLCKINALNDDPQTLKRALFLSNLPADVRSILARQ
ncbi:Gag pol protein [Elysia marginata]|uniref:Gag pol protein n=1 Tax=Elysia marginata TaxID=1093978 RepID=A0AAV4F5A6_9GAST|nr:Gag pol protein [Elysia marginata]